MHLPQIAGSEAEFRRLHGLTVTAPSARHAEGTKVGVRELWAHLTSGASGLLHRW